MSRRVKIEQPVGLTFPHIGDRWYVFFDGRNQLRGYGTLEEAEEAAAAYFDPKRKRTV